MRRWFVPSMFTLAAACVLWPMTVPGQTEFDRAGNFHSEALHVVERYTPTGPNHLLYEATIEDPNVFARPWKISMPLYRRQEQDIELLEYQCHAYLLEQEWDNPESTFFDEH